MRLKKCLAAGKKRIDKTGIRDTLLMSVHVVVFLKDGEGRSETAVSLRFFVYSFVFTSLSSQNRNARSRACMMLGRSLVQNAEST